VLLRLPVQLYRARLGWLLGGRFVRLTHTGRTSGRRREVVLEVVQRDRASGRVWVASGFGPRADWYRNVLAHPEVAFQVGRRRRAGTAHALPAEEGATLMAGYATAHPRAAERLGRFMGFGVDGSAEDYREVGRQVPFVRLDPR
jgi:deazaflavin-dependent oxidoreductase (nitroreductase family)